MGLKPRGTIKAHFEMVGVLGVILVDGLVEDDEGISNKEMRDMVGQQSIHTCDCLELLASPVS